jgi:predicted DCC family thiol-disulfide oxidoreductase YuxK
MSRYTMLYDGNCRICCSQADLVRSFNSQDRIEVLDLHDPSAIVRFPQFSAQAVRSELHLVAPDGSVHIGAAAVREVLLRLPSLRGLGEILALPGMTALAAPFYRLVAANRYLFGGRPTACEDDSCAR